MPQITKVEDIDAGILHFEATMREYSKAGGALPSESEMKEDLIDTLPGSIVRELRLLDTTGSRTSFHAFIAHVKECAADEIFNKSKSGNGVHVAAESPECSPCGSSDDDFEAYKAEVNAVMHKRFPNNSFRGKPGGAPSAGGADRRPTGPAREIKCGNCGGKHDTKECKKPRIALDKRACFECGGIGHNARDCPKKGQNAVTESDATDSWFGCLTDSGPQVPKKAARPQPQARTLGAFMGKAPVKTSNSFEALSGNECTIERKKGRKPPLGTAPKAVSGTIGERTPAARRPKTYDNQRDPGRDGRS
jgi:hypothetical protein